GSATYLVTSGGVPGTSSGTSFSSPVMAGMGACLLQANPWANVKQVKMAIEQSAHQYSKPDSLLGYGIPDFEKADKYLKVNFANDLKAQSGWTISPNPFFDYIFLRNLNPERVENCRITIYSMQGLNIWESTFAATETILLKNLGNLPKGFLIMNIQSGEKKQQFKLIKTE
ncbi:MAG: S8 family peptidase, partial [Bacteroidota bacterium]|nr:S8 family peptidase [Bacteroidota bacterium]